MRRLIQVLLVALAGLAVGACAGPAVATQHPTGLTGPAARVVDFPASAGSGDPREVRVLMDEPALRLVTIILRNGTVLPPHGAPMPVTIHALHGAGTVVVGADRLRIDPAHAVVLRANVQHTVEPDATTDLVLLVYHLGDGHESHQ